VLEHPAAPNILRTPRIALIKLQHDQRAADFLAGQQFEMRSLLAGANVEFRPNVSLKLGVPLSGPTDNRDDATLGSLEIEVRQRAACPSPAVASQPYVDAFVE
jgi:hypothetical protein